MASRRIDQPGAVLPPRPFDVRRDGAVLAGLVSSGVLLGAGAAAQVRGPALVLAGVFAIVAGLAWAQELLRCWAVADDWIGVRRWLRWTRLRVDDIDAVHLDPEDPFGDTLVFSGRRFRSIPVPLDRGRTDPRFGHHLHTLVERCRRRGAVQPEAAAVLDSA